MIAWLTLAVQAATAIAAPVVLASLADGALRWWSALAFIRAQRAALEATQ